MPLKFRLAPKRYTKRGKLLWRVRAFYELEGKTIEDTDTGATEKLTNEALDKNLITLSKVQAFQKTILENEKFCLLTCNYV